MSFPDVPGFDPTADGDLEFNMVVTDTVGDGSSGAMNDGVNSGAVLPVEDDFTRTMKDIAQRLGSIAGKVSEAGIRRLATASGFEVFEDKIDIGKRLSLSGTIILIDIDLDKLDNVADVKLSLASTVQISDEQKAFNSKTLVPSADSILLELLQKSLLTDFAVVLRSLARVDRLSMPNAADCFVCIDEMAFALMTKTKNDNVLGEYGIVMQNPKKHLGTGIWYWTSRRWLKKDDIEDSRKSFALLTLMPLSDTLDIYHSDELTKCTMRYCTTWLDGDGNWTDPEPILGAKGAFMLELSEPVLMTRKAALELGAVFDTKDQSEEEEMGLSRLKRNVYLPNGNTETLQLSYLQATTDQLVQVDFIPLPHPRDIPAILKVLRKHQLLWALWNSVLKVDRAEEIEREGTEQAEMSFADAIMECDSIDRASKTHEANSNSAAAASQLKLLSVLLTNDGSDLQLHIGLSCFEEITFKITAMDEPGRLSVTPEHSLSSKLKRALELTEDIPLSLVSLIESSTRAHDSNN